MVRPSRIQRRNAAGPFHNRLPPEGRDPSGPERWGGDSTGGILHTVGAAAAPPPPPPCGSFQRALSFSLRNCATLRSSGSDPASGGTLRSCPALALRAMCPSLAVTSPFRGAYVPHAPVFPGCQLRGLWSGKCTLRMENYHPQALDWTRTSDALTTRFSGPLSQLSYKGIYPDGSRRSTAAWQGREMEWERRAYTPTLPFSHRFCFVCTRSGARSKFFCDRLKGYSLSPSSQHNSSRLI